MSTRWFKEKSRWGIGVGLAVFLVGMTFFITFDAVKLEKMGVFLMTLGAMMIGMGYTAYVALKQRN